MRTVQIPADRLTTRHRIVENSVGPRGGLGGLTSVPISEVVVAESRVTIRVRANGENVQRVHKATDMIRVEQKIYVEVRVAQDKFQQTMALVMEMAGS